MSDVVKNHLTDETGAIIIKEYKEIFDEISKDSANSKIWISPLSSYAIYNSVSNKVFNLNLFNIVVYLYFKIYS